MNYRLEVLTPMLVGDGRALSPIDYMVWKDQVNVLNQERIVKLLARGPRLDGYLNQIRRAEKLDFANWGGLAQNYAGRRIPFEHSTLTKHWEQQRAEYCHIPTFACSASGPYLPGSALRGALRTVFIASRAGDRLIANLDESSSDDRPLRRPGEVAERQGEMMRALPVSDSSVVARAAFKVFMVRVSTLTGGGGKYSLGWKSTSFAEMAEPGTVFEGRLAERFFFRQEATMESLRWKEAPRAALLVRAANQYAAQALEGHRQYAATAGIGGVAQCVDGLRARLAEVADRDDACLVALGWGTGIYGKTVWPRLDDEAYRRVLGRQAVYSRAIRSGLPFPKTRRVVFQNDQPSALPGWALLTVA
jgi:CRISPR-associated protein Csm5